MRASVGALMVLISSPVCIHGTAWAETVPSNKPNTQDDKRPQLRLAQRGRGVTVQPSATQPPTHEDDSGEPTTPGLIITPFPPKSLGGAAAVGGPTILFPRETRIPPRPKEPIRLALRGGALDSKVATPGHTPYSIIAAGANPDLIWDATTRDVVAGDDVLAQNVNSKDLLAIVDRAAVIKWLNGFSGQNALPIRVSPSRHVHREGENIDVSISDVSGRNLVVFSLSGDGSLNFLYPLKSDPPVVRDPEYSLSFVAREPFGADQIIAISSPTRLMGLEQSLKALGNDHDPAKVIDIISRSVTQEDRLGTVGLFTSR